MLLFRLFLISLFILGLTVGWYNLNYKNQERVEQTTKVEETVLAQPKASPTPQATETRLKVQKPIQVSSPAPVVYEVPSLQGGTIFNLINNYRQSKGLWTFSVSDELCALAEKRVDFLMANDMAAAKASVPGNHVGLYDQVQSYSGTGVAENFVSNAYTDQEVLTAWQNSPPHNAVLLSTKTVREDQPPEARTDITKGCIAIRIKGYESMVVLLVGDK